MKRDFYEIKGKILSLVYPNRCPFCGELIGNRLYYCKDCIKHLPYASYELENPENCSRLVAVCNYTREVRKAMLKLKFGRKLYIAETFAEMMTKRLRSMDIIADMVVPVPSGFRSVMRHGISSGTLISKRVARKLGLPYAKAVNAFFAKKEQKNFSAANRSENAKHSFYFSGKTSVIGKRILLIDDVVTTGSTLREVAAILISNGASEVTACVFARAVINYSGTDGTLRLKKPRGIPFIN